MLVYVNISGEEEFASTEIEFIPAKYVLLIIIMKL